MDGMREVKCDGCGHKFISICHKETNELECPSCNKMIFVPEYKGLFVSIKNKKMPVHLCTCGECENEFYVPGISIDWKPSYCPYCGIKFVRDVVK